MLRLAAQGLTDQQIADALFMSRRTATTHQANIRQKLGVQNRAEAVAYARGRQVIPAIERPLRRFVELAGHGEPVGFLESPGRVAHRQIHHANDHARARYRAILAESGAD